MILVACVDDNLGMMFHKRRQSQDRAVRQDILKEVGKGILWMNAYSYRQFAQMQDERIKVHEDFFHQAGEQDWCFVENVSAAPYEANIDKILLYHWNRNYPADLRFDIPLETNGWKSIDVQEFAGHSHENITKVVYTR